MKKPDFAAGIAAKLAEKETPPPPPDTSRPPSRLTEEGRKKVAIAGYFEPEVRKQLAILAVQEEKSQVAMIAEALNLLFEKYGLPPIARG